MNDKPKAVVLESQNLIDLMEFVDYEIERLAIEPDLIKKSIGYLDIIERYNKLILEGKSV